MITEQQIDNISKLPPEDQFTILQICAEELAIVSVDEYCKIMAEKKRNVYYKIKQGTIKSLEISGKRYPVVNLSLSKT